MNAASRYVVCEGREIHYMEWGAGNAETVIAWHGLARTGRDMDEIAAHLSSRFRVICPDTIGRGLSQWSPDPGKEYCLAFYGRLAVSLMDQLGVSDAHWLGTSMGWRHSMCRPLTLPRVITSRWRVARLLTG